MAEIHFTVKSSKRMFMYEKVIKALVKIKPKSSFLTHEWSVKFKRTVTAISAQHIKPFPVQSRTTSLH